MNIHKIFLTAAAAAVMLAVSAAPLPTGAKLKQLPSPLFLDDSTHALNEFTGKKLIVLHLWEMNPAALQEFSTIANTAAKYREIADFIGIGIGNHDNLKKFPGAVRLGFPVNSDRGKAKELFLRSGDQLPMTVILDKNATILWRGNLRQLPGILTLCHEGKFDLNEQIRLEIFSDAVNSAMKDGKFADALKLVQTEFAKNQRMSLFKLQIQLLQKLDRTQEAFSLIRTIEEKHPENFRIFEQEYILIAATNQLDKLPDFFDRLIKNFTARPDVLLAFATAEFSLPPEKFNPAYVFKLLEAGWAGQQFKTPETRAMYALDYARMLHGAGRTDLAVKLAQTACADLKDKPKQLPKAEAALNYYSKIRKIAQELKLPDLKK